MSPLRSLRPYFWTYKYHLLGGVVFITLTNVLAVFAPAVVGEGINALQRAYTQFLAPLEAGQSAAEVFDGAKIKLELLGDFFGDLGQFTPTSKQEVLQAILSIATIQALLYLAVFAIKGVFSFFTRQTIIVMSRHIEYDLKKAIYSQYQRLSVSFYKQNETGDLMNRISEDVSRVRMYLGPAVLYSLSLVIMVVMTVSVMVRIDWGLTLWSLAPLPFMSIGVYYVSAIIHRRSEEVQAGQSDLSAMVQQNFSGIRVLAAYARETAALLRFSTAADLYKERSLKLVKVEALFIPLIVMLVGLSTVLTIYIGGLRVLDGRLEMGHIFQFIFYINLLTWPFASVGWVTSLVQKAAASQGRINAFLDLEPEIQSDAAPHEVKGRITFENVGLTYPDSGIRALEGVSFDLEAGQTLGIVGRTGSGKSTVAQLIARLYDADTGRVLIDGRPIQDCDLGSLRGAMGYAPQDVFLFSDSIHNNIAFGSADATAEEVEAAAKEAAVHEDIAGFPEGYQTLLGERGVNLSGGQKQRIAIARALLASPAILVLDDVLSAVDTATEAHILKALEGVRKGRTAVMISHRVSTVAGADLLLVLDAGRVVERGTHEELLALKGEYYKMHIRDTARRTR